MSAGDRAAAIVLILLSGAALLLSLGLGITRPVMPGAGLFPLLAALGLGVFSALWLWQRVRAAAGGRAGARGGETSAPEASTTAASLAPAPTPTDSTPSARGAGRAVALVVAMVVFAILLRPLGFLISAILLMSFTAYVTGERRWAWILGVAVVGSVLIGALFGALGAQLP